MLLRRAYIAIFTCFVRYTICNPNLLEFSMAVKTVDEAHSDKCRGFSTSIT